jgi:hypothetical protein
MSTDRTTEILNYLTAISREVGEMRSEMQRRFDGLESDVKEIKRDLKLLQRIFIACAWTMKRLKSG